VIFPAKEKKSYGGSEGTKVNNSISISRNSVLASHNFHYFYWVRILSMTSDFLVSIIGSSLFIALDGYYGDNVVILSPFIYFGMVFGILIIFSYPS